MSGNPVKNLKKCRGIIVWDFDGVLFDIKRFKEDNSAVFKKHGVSAEFYEKMREKMRNGKIIFSISGAVRMLRRMRLKLSERKIRQELHNLLSSGAYLDPSADKLLHKLRKAGFCHMILSFGTQAFQYKKIHVGCGHTFRRHFWKMRVTRQPKFLFIKKIIKSYPETPAFFIDDTKEHIDLVKKNLPRVKTVFYTGRKSLKEVARLILKNAK